MKGSASSYYVKKVAKILALTFYFLLVALPLYWMIITSFKVHEEIINPHVVTYFPETITFESYNLLFTILNYQNYLLNSVTFSVISASLVVLLAIFSGYAMARFNFKGKLAVLTFFLATQMIPGILILIPVYSAYNTLGLLDNPLGLILFYIATNLPFCVITMRSFFYTTPQVLEEAAYVDGCTRLQALIRIILPIMLPGIIAVFVFAFIGSWNDLVATLTFTNTPQYWTVPVGLKSLIGKYNVQWGALMAGGVLALIPSALMFMFVQKYIVSGLTTGAVKG